ncbi:MAG TPA: hypothetical protein VIV40_33035 [Kofleriaceae bacterium]
MTWTRASWWSWLVTIIALAAGRLGWSFGVPIAFGVTAGHALVLAIAGGKAFAVQVRVTYLILIALDQSWLHWAQIAGTLVLLGFDYCPIARLLALMPWNRRQPLTFALVRTVITSPPTTGSILAIIARNERPG